MWPETLSVVQENNPEKGFFGKCCKWRSGFSPFGLLKEKLRKNKQLERLRKRENLYSRIDAALKETDFNVSEAETLKIKSD